MENASKALLIAAAVLVAIILIALGMKIYSSTTEAQKVGINTGETISSKTQEATDIATAEITEEKKSFIEYGQKSAEKVTVGDDISIGTGENKQWFTVINNNGSVITAIAHYNIDLYLDRDIYQTKDIKETPFAYYKYWNSNSDIDINYTNKVNNLDLSNIVNKYIKQYEKTLKKLRS